MLTAPQKILVVHVAGLARTTLALPALRALRHALPYSHITVAASTAAADVVRLAACADEVLPVGRLRQAQVLAPRAAYRSLKTVGALRRESYDLAIEFEKSTETGLLLFAAQPAERLRERATSGGKLKRALERVADVLATGIIAPKHAAHRYLDALAPLGVYATEAAPRVFTDHAADERFEKRLKKNSLNEGLLVGVHPGAGGGKPRWPLERFADVASRLVHLLDARVLVFAGRQERGLAKQLVGMLPPKRAVALESLPLADAVSALARLSVMVANHAGVAHLAAAVGTPVVAVSPAPSPTPYDLLGAQHRHVRGPHVEAVAADEVYEAACRLVSLSRAELLVTR
jgi:ADP-heptose:LPS heptosyltransferase